MRYTSLIIVWLLTLVGNAEETPIPEPQLDVLYNYCIDCHDDASSKGDLNLDFDTIDWTAPEALHHWAEVYTRIERGKMPPKKKSQPSIKEKQQLLSWINKQLMDNSPIGGAPLRRLNRREFQNTLQSIFPIPDLKLPAGFPQDNESHGFDTVSEALVISPSHLEAYQETATMVADYLFPQPRKTPEPKLSEFQPRDLAISYSSAALVEGAMRIASKGSRTRNATWLSRFEAPESGIYKVSIDVSAKNPPTDSVPIFGLQAAPLSGKGATRALSTLKIEADSVQTLSTEIELFRGETLIFTYQNAPFDFENKSTFPDRVRTIFTKDPKLAAAWQATNKGKRGVPRGGVGWERVKSEMAENPDAVLPKNQIDKLASLVARNNVAAGETLVFKYFEEGPNIGIHSASVEGPLSLVEDDLMRAQTKARNTFLGNKFTDSKKGLEKFFTRYLSKIFRQPVTIDDISPYLTMVESQTQAGYPVDQGLHLAIRTSLLSPRFLYKENGNTPDLGPYELASRLSYFLTSSPPDFKLLKQAETGDLADSNVLSQQAQRLLRSSGKSFARDFTSQWLDTDILDTLMPDAKLLRGYNENYKNSLKDEVVTTFLEILSKNQPVTNFINPDFIYTNPTIGWEIYEIASFKPSQKAKRKKGKLGPLKRVDIGKGSRYGGLLGMPAVMMATANGVDTQPVIRGVWVLENIIGRPPPEPPNSIPALSPDLNGAMTLRERLTAHQADASCASCHEDIDPVGFVLENFDAVGKWRTNYPGKRGQPVDASGVLPEGTQLSDVTDLKKWLENHPEYFSNCLAEKLMIYATGRILNYREKRILEGIVEKNLEQGNRFQDLLLALVTSELFRVR